MLEDFEPIARRDRQRRRSRSGSNSSTRKNGPSESVEPVEITYEKWSVLQIDSHSDQMGAFIFALHPLYTNHLFLQTILGLERMSSLHLWLPPGFPSYISLRT